ncbi:unnamed protein product [Pleuronectes platessa]|uniref:KHDRBS Qua1 domain-containing protein n=1 Tax=Pleuronectes platessa TaxID=8262 RepID=A0A9N7VWD8_PLEPL|nr:unnamed protein product [Pleuronectes platessa]
MESLTVWCVMRHEPDTEMKEAPLEGLSVLIRGHYLYTVKIEKIQKDEGKEEEKFIDVVINKNMKLGQKVLIPVKQFPKIRASAESEYATRHRTPMYRVLDSQLRCDLPVKSFAVATFESTSASQGATQRFIGATRTVHDRDFPLGAGWGG